MTLRLAEAAEKASSSLDNIARMETGQGSVANGNTSGGMDESGTGYGGVTTTVPAPSSQQVTRAPAPLPQPVPQAAPQSGYASSAVPATSLLPMGASQSPSSYAAPAPSYEPAPYQAAPTGSGAPPELAAPVTISWNGPVEALLKVLAQRAGYGFTTSGHKPPVPLTIAVDAYQQPLIEVIKSAALQVAGKADVVLDAASQRIEVRYAATAANSF